MSPITVEFLAQLDFRSFDGFSFCCRNIFAGAINVESQQRQGGMIRICFASAVTLGQALERGCDSLRAIFRENASLKAMRPLLLPDCACMNTILSANSAWVKGVDNLAEGSRAGEIPWIALQLHCCAGIPRA